MLKDLLRKGDWLAKIDLKDAFFSIPMHPSHKKVSQVHFQREDIPIQLSPLWPILSSVDVHKDSEVSTGHSHGGVRLIACINNLLILAEFR